MVIMEEGPVVSRDEVIADSCQLRSIREEVIMQSEGISYDLWGKSFLGREQVHAKSGGSPFFRLRACPCKVRRKSLCSQEEGLVINI